MLLINHEYLDFDKDLGSQVYAELEPLLEMGAITEALARAIVGEWSVSVFIDDKIAVQVESYLGRLAERQEN